MSRHRTAAVLALALLAVPSAAAAQGVSVALGRLFSDDARPVFRLDLARPVLGPVGFNLHGTAIGSPSGTSAALWGAGADLTFFQNGTSGFYAVAGLDGGFGFGEADDVWGSWSAGLGYEVFPFDVLVFGVEGRWRELSLASERGPELSLRLGARFGRARGGATPGGGRPRALADHAEPGISGPPTLGDPASGSEVAAVLDGVVSTATEAIGTRYRLGGAGDGDGFDCSGLIQYAYGEHGIELPRVSADQARAGREVGKEVASLRPGDILTFAISGRRVSHVGLYIGDGRFIHSASGGVRISVLDEDDPDGRYWLRRWIGSRRILE